MSKRRRSRSILRPEARIPKGLTLSRVIAALPKLISDDAANRKSALDEFRHLNMIAVFGEEFELGAIIREALVSPEIDSGSVLDGVANQYYSACLRISMPFPTDCFKDPDYYESEDSKQREDGWLARKVYGDILANCGAEGIAIIPTLERMLKDGRENGYVADGVIKAMLQIGEPAATITDALLDNAFRMGVTAECLEFVGKYGLTDEQLEYVTLSVYSFDSREVFVALYLLRTLGERAMSAEPAVRRRANAYAEGDSYGGFGGELRELARTTLDAMDGNPNEAARRWLPQLNWGNDPPER